MKTKELTEKLNTMIEIIHNSNGVLSESIKIAADTLAHVEIDWSDVAKENFVDTYDELENLFVIMNSEINHMEEKVYV